LTYLHFDLNNPGNIGYSDWTARHGGSPSSARDTGHAIASFPDLATGYEAVSTLALNKYNAGFGIAQPFFVCGVLRPS